jgi:hypothetical protein
MEGNGVKLAAMLGVGLLCLEVALTGKLGSLLGAIIDPAAMTEGNFNQGSSAGGTLGPSGSSGSTTYSEAPAILISQVFGPYTPAALKIAQCESGMNPNAYNPQSVNGSNATGLFQILYPSTWNTTSYRGGNPKDAMTNIRAAYEIFRRDGYSWREWACAPIVGVS